MAKRKILFIGQFAPPVHGVSVMNDYLLHSKRLSREFDFVKINLTTAKSIENIGQSSPVKYLKFAGILLKTLFRLATNRFHLAYLTLSPVGYAFIKDSIIVRLVKAFHVPVVLHLHGKGIGNAINAGGQKTHRQYQAVFNNTHVITLSAGLQQDIAAIDTYNQVFVVNNGLPVVEIPAKQPTAGPVTVLMLANLIKSKGAMDLLKAAKIIKTQSPGSFRMVFAGAWGETGFQDEFTRFIATHNLRDVVELPGPVYQEAKRKTLAQADIFVLPTYYANECFPLTILEAMQYGLPVIATNEGAIAEMVVHNKTGLIVPARQPEQLAAAVASLINNPQLRKQMGTEAKARFNNHYTLDIFEEKMHNVFTRTSS